MELNHLTAINIVSAEAARAHDKTTRNDGITPYIVHPARVATLVEHFGGGHIAIISAWLHDVFEDCNQDICRGIKKAIKDLPLPENEVNEINTIISALTKNSQLLKEVRMEASLNRILDSPKEAVLIKICDRIDNLIDAHGRDETFLKKYIKEAEVISKKLDYTARSSGYSQAIQCLNSLIQTRKKDYRNA